MIKNFHFKDIKSFLEEENIGVEILDKFDKLFDAAVIFTPFVCGMDYLPILSILEVKDRLVNIGKSILESINSIHKPDYVTREEQIKCAYTLIVYTSYFDALDEIVPKKAFKALKKQLEIDDSLEMVTANDRPGALLTYGGIPFSDHIDSFSETINQLTEIYESTSDKICQLFRQLKCFENNKDLNIDIKVVMNRVNKLAIKKYKAQYLDLASNFSDFAFYVQSLEFQSIYNSLDKLNNRMESIENNTLSIDVGFRVLNELVNSLNNNSINSNSQDIVKELKSTYRKEILKPIIDSEEIFTDDEFVKLKFPKIIDAFIPQSYKCLSYTERNMKLEEPKVWDSLKPHNDLDAFFIKYLSNPNSINNPLVILGHPGSGKSLLTKVLSAQLMCDYYTVIRIPLREVNAESSIDMLVENQIRKDSNRPLISGYGGFAKEFSEKPLLIILDGYDELLQAKGEVYSNYLQNVKIFQEHQKDLNRPVRIIVTSRITLIDKAIIPENSTIVRLLEFNEEQQNTWINIWNKENENYFKYNNVLPFCLLDQSNKRIMELAEQPLLLLMLAMYDADGNSLAKLKNEIKRTQLYNNLLRRFVLRERKRYNGFLNLSSNEKLVIINNEMRRLGVVAIGMYNRQTVYIHSNELENDLKFYSLHRERKKEVKGKKLNDSESLLAGFFFIHESKAKDEETGNEGLENAYEFLHNTFGEFLTADFILNCATYEICRINTYKTTPSLSSELLKLQTNEVWLNKEWYSCLMFTPLYTRTVVLEMMQEHKAKVIKDNNLDEKIFCDCFKFIVENELKKMLNYRCFPSVMYEDNLFERDMSLLECISVYTMNLIILASVLCPDGFKFDEKNYVDNYNPDENISSWRKLCSLWRSCFSEKDLTGLASIVKANRIDESNLQIISNEKFESMPYKNLVDITLCVSFALSETFNIGLTGFHSRHPLEILKMNLEEYLCYYKNNYPAFYIQLLINMLNIEINRTNVDCNEVTSIIRSIISSGIDFIKSDFKIVLQLLETLELSITKMVVYVDVFDELLVFLDDLFTKITFSLTDSESIILYHSMIQYRIACLTNMPRECLTLNYGRNNFIIKNFEYNSQLFKKINLCKVINERNLNTDILSTVYNYYDEINVVCDRDVLIDIKDIIEKRTMLEWLNTAPEMISQLVRMLVQGSKNINWIVMSEYLDAFCQKFLKAHPGCYSYKTIIDSVIISKYYKDLYKDYHYYNNIIQNIHKHFKIDKEYFINTLFYVPLFICDLIKFAPKLFREFDLSQAIRFINYKQHIVLSDDKKVFDIIKAIRLLDDINHGELNISYFNYISSYILQSTSFFENLESFSVIQLKDLLWFSNVIKNNELKEKVFKALFSLNN